MLQNQPLVTRLSRQYGLQPVDVLAGLLDLMALGHMEGCRKHKGAIRTAIKELTAWVNDPKDAPPSVMGALQQHLEDMAKAERATAKRWRAMERKRKAKPDMSEAFDRQATAHTCLAHILKEVAVAAEHESLAVDVEIDELEG